MKIKTRLKVAEIHKTKIAIDVAARAAVEHSLTLANDNYSEEVKVKHNESLDTHTFDELTPGDEVDITITNENEAAKELTVAGFAVDGQQLKLTLADSYGQFHQLLLNNGGVAELPTKVLGYVDDDNRLVLKFDIQDLGDLDLTKRNVVRS